MSYPLSDPNRQRAPLLIVLSGPSGVGKDAVISSMRKLGKPYHFTVTATTRLKRHGERDGIDYIFTEETGFRRMIQHGEFLEWARVYDNFYGVPKAQVLGAFEKGNDVIMKIDVQGAATVKGMAPEAILIFLAPPSIEDLERRLLTRTTESSKAVRIRLRAAEREMEQASRFDYIVINRHGQVDDAVDEIEAIVAQERVRIPPRIVSL